MKTSIAKLPLQNLPQVKFPRMNRQVQSLALLATAQKHSRWGLMSVVCLASLILMRTSNAKADHVLSLSFATNMISEAQIVGATRATVVIDVALTNALTVLIFNTDPTEISVPTSIVIPAGTNAATFFVDGVNDGDIDGNQIVTLTVDAEGFLPSSALLTVIDDDTSNSRTVGGKLFGTIATGIYRVTSDLTVETGRTLRIQPSTSLLFNPGKGLTNAGTLIAQAGLGTEIVFGSAAVTPTNGDWQGITVTSSGAPQTIFDHVNVAYANYGLQVIPSGDQANLTVSHSNIHHCSSDAIRVFADSGIVIETNAVQILSNRLYRNGRNGISLSAFVHVCAGSRNSATVIGNDIFENISAGVILSAQAHHFQGCTQIHRSRVNCQIANNYIHGNDYGIHGYADHGFVISGRLYPTILNNLILNNTLGGVWLDGAPKAELLPSVINNTIARNGGAGIYHGINVDSGFTIENNLVMGNSEGIHAGAIFTPTNAVVAFNDVWGNGFGNWINYPLEYGTLTATNINGTPADARMNISEDPQVSEQEGYHLPPTSPAVDAATRIFAPTTDFEGQSRRGFPDIGYDESVAVLLRLTAPPSSGGIQIGLTGGRALRYSIQYTTNFVAWQTVATNVTLTNRNTAVRISVPTFDNHGFYRATLQP